MQMNTHWQNDIFIVELEGKLMGGPDSDSFHDEVREAVQQGGRNVIVDLKGVDWLNSWGVGLLVSAFTTLKSRGGLLVLSGCTPKVMTVLRMTRFDSVFTFGPDVPTALKNLAASTQV